MYAYKFAKRESEGEPFSGEKQDVCGWYRAHAAWGMGKGVHRKLPEARLGMPHSEVSNRLASTLLAFFQKDIGPFGMIDNSSVSVQFNSLFPLSELPTWRKSSRGWG